MALSLTPTPNTASVYTALWGLPPPRTPCLCLGGCARAPSCPTNADHAIKNRASLLVPVMFRYKVFPQARRLARPPGQDSRPRARAPWHRHREK